MFEIVNLLGSTDNITSIDLTNSNVTLIEKIPPITTATEQMERNIDLQDRRQPMRASSSYQHRRKKTFFNPLRNALKNTVIPSQWLHYFSNVQLLALSGSIYITDQSIRTLPKMMPLLETVDVSNCRRLTNKSMLALSLLSHLGFLNVSRCSKITSTAMSLFWGTVEHLLVSECPLVGDEMILGSIRKKKDLGTEKCGRLVLYDRVKKKRRPRKMRTLHLAGCPNITDASVLRIKLRSFSTLTSLNLRGCNLTDSAVKRLFASISAPLILLDLSNMPLITNDSMENLRQNRGNQRVAGTGAGGKFRWLKEISVQDSGVNSVEFLSWLVESASELVTLGIGRSQEVVQNISPQLNTVDRSHIGKCLSLLRRLRHIKFGYEHIEMMVLSSNSNDRKDTTDTTDDDEIVAIPDIVLSQSLSKRQYLQFKTGEHSFTYRLPKTHPERILQPVKVTTQQSSIPMGCEENRHSGVAINGNLKGFYGDRVVDKDATTTITGLEKQSWWSVDLGKREKVGVIKILLPEQYPPTYLLPRQFPFWLFCYREPLPEGSIGDRERCPCRSMQRYSVFSHRVVWNPSAKVGRSIHIRIPPDIPSFRVLRIQQETIDGLVEGRPLSLCEVQILPMRLQSIQCDGAEVLVDHHLLKQNYHLTNRTFGKYQQMSQQEQQEQQEQSKKKNQDTCMVAQKKIIRVRLAGLASKYLNGQCGTMLGDVSDTDDGDDDRVKVRLDESETVVTVRRVNTFDIEATAARSRLLGIFPKLAHSHGGIV